MRGLRLREKENINILEDCNWEERKILTYYYNLISFLMFGWGENETRKEKKGFRKGKNLKKRKVEMQIIKLII